MLQQCFRQPFARGDNPALARRSGNAGPTTSADSAFSKMSKYRRHSFYRSQTNCFMQFIWFLLKFLQCLPMPRCSNFVNPSPLYFAGYRDKYNPYPPFEMLALRCARRPRSQMQSVTVRFVWPNTQYCFLFSFFDLSMIAAFDCRCCCSFRRRRGFLVPQ